MRADELLEAGDPGGQAVWLRVLKAVEELLDKGPPQARQGSLSAPHEAWPACGSRNSGVALAAAHGLSPVSTWGGFKCPSAV